MTSTSARPNSADPRIENSDVAWRCELTPEGIALSFAPKICAPKICVPKTHALKADE